MYVTERKNELISVTQPPPVLETAPWGDFGRMLGAVFPKIALLWLSAFEAALGGLRQRAGVLVECPIVRGRSKGI